MKQSSTDLLDCCTISRTRAELPSLLTRRGAPDRRATGLGAKVKRITRSLRVDVGVVPQYDRGPQDGTVGRSLASLCLLASDS